MNRAVLACVLVALTARDAYAQGKCPENREMAGTIGIARFECVGRSCSVSERDARGGYAHNFAVEPSVGSLTAAVSPARELRVGDVVLAIDGVPITTREGGRRIANLAVGDTVLVRIRREGEEMELALVPVLGCNTPSLSVRVP
jgi:hypothetical protein